MNSARALLIAVLVAAPTFTYAQAGITPPTPAEVAEQELKQYTALLNLSSAQQEQALPIFTTEATATASLRSTERTDQEALDAAIVADDAAILTQLSATLGTLSGQQILARSVAGAAFYKILTAEQQSKLTALAKTHLLNAGGHGGPPPIR